MRDRSPVWIGLCDLALAVLAIVIVAVNPPAPKARGVEMKAELLATVEWAVDIDADVDIHMMPPSHHPVFYGARDVGCATLDRDNRGFLDSIITLADGSQTRVDSDKETIAIRCIEPGHYDFGANLYAYRVGGAGQENRRDLGLKAHVEIIALNPVVKVLISKDITLDTIGQTVNWASFDMGRDGVPHFVDPPLESITHDYQKRIAGAP